MNHVEMGQWYWLKTCKDPVEVIDIDENQELIEIQHFNGDIEEMNLLDWYNTMPTNAPDPKESDALFEEHRSDLLVEELFQDYNKMRQ